MQIIENTRAPIPRDTLKNLEYRREVLTKCLHPGPTRDMIYELCSRDPIFWINTFCYTKDPKKPTVSKVPFILYEDFQDEAIWEIIQAIETGNDLLIEKTRDMGASWLILYAFTWFWLFRDNSDFRAGSRKEDFVDKLGDMDTLFEKIRFCLRFLPGWMLPVGYQESEHATYMKIINPVNGNSIVGESANPQFGSGGRRKAVLLDEFSKWDASVSESAWTSTADVTRCRIPCSTPLGSGNKFAELANGTKEKIKKLTLHWTLHPDKAKDSYYIDADGTKVSLPDHKTAYKIWEKNRQQKGGIIIRSPWYDAECERRSDSDIAQELDVDYARSGYPFFTMAAVKRQRVWLPYVRKNPFSRVPFGYFVSGKIVENEHKFRFVETQDDPWINIFELPEPYLEYLGGGDTAEGLEKGDESVFCILNKYTTNTAATIHGNHSPETFEIYCHLASKFFNGALSAVENAVYGYKVNAGMEKLGTNLYYTRKDETKDGQQETPKRGFTTDARTRPAMLAMLEEDIRKGSTELRDGKLIAQCQTFIKNPKKGGRPEADGKMHDDCVIARAIAGYVLRENPFKPRQTSAAPAKVFTAQKNAGFGF
jgi:hypothetical protein